MIDASTYMQDPTGRTRFFGLYEGVVVETEDPLKQNRIRLTVTITGIVVSKNWARALLPITSNSNHPDHQEHTAAQIAALLTTTAATITSSSGGDPSHTHTTTVPALTVVAKPGAGTLKHPHKVAVDVGKKWNGSYKTVFNDATIADEHTPHRYVPNIGQRVWVMFVAGLPEEPVWIGVQ